MILGMSLLWGAIAQAGMTSGAIDLESLNADASNVEIRPVVARPESPSAQDAVAPVSLPKMPDADRDDSHRRLRAFSTGAY